MKTLKIISFLFITALVLASCKSGSNRQIMEDRAVAEMQYIAPEIAPPPPPPPPMAMEEMNMKAEGGISRGIQIIPEIKRKIIRDGNMEIRVNNLSDGKKTVDSLVKQLNGYYSNESFSNADNSRGYTLTIRIPSESFDRFIARLESGTGEVVYKNISSRDVTEEFIDLETRLANKRNYLKSYNDLLKQAKSIKDILEIQEKTRSIEEELESVIGRLKYLNSQVDFSTLQLQISKKNDFNQYSNYKGNFIDRLKQSLVKGWFGLVSFFLWVVKLWPFWIIIGATIYTFIKIRRKSKKK